MVDGFLANLGVGIVSRFRSSLLAIGLAVLSRTESFKCGIQIPRVKHASVRCR